MSENIKLPPEFKQRWITALRSGQYRQGSHHLKYNDAEGEKFCCLGVACELLKDELNLVEESDEEADDDLFPHPNLFSRNIKKINGEVETLPKKILGYLDLDTSIKDINELPVFLLEKDGLRIFKRIEFFSPTYLTTLNDSKISFSEIADIIEEYL